jgi:hypothetical protein
MPIRNRVVVTVLSAAYLTPFLFIASAARSDAFACYTKVVGIAKSQSTVSASGVTGCFPVQNGAYSVTITLTGPGGTNSAHATSGTVATATTSVPCVSGLYTATATGTYGTNQEQMNISC